jgi:hypothetical protein
MAYPEEQSNSCPGGKDMKAKRKSSKKFPAKEEADKFINSSNDLVERIDELCDGKSYQVIIFSLVRLWMKFVQEFGNGKP